MKIDAPLLTTDLATIGAEARALEALGYDGAFTFEGPHDPFFPPAFRSELYRHTLMTPFFNPGASPFGPPRVFLGGVDAAMTAVAGEVAAGSSCTR